MTDKELRRLVRAFRKGILDGNRSTDFCWMISAPLASYLAAVGIHATLIEGYVRKNSHFWLVLEDGRIIDATADQFRKPGGARMPAVFIGKMPSWYSLKKDSERMVAV